MKQKTILVLLACVLVLPLAGCGTPEDRAMVKDFIEEWVRSKKMHPINEEGGVDLEGIWNLGTRVVTGSTGDAEVDAVLDAYEVIDTIHKADQLMAEGSRNRDASKMDEAITMRPGDWTYRVSRAALALEQGDIGQYKTQFDAARAGSQGKDPLWFIDQSAAELQQVETKLTTSGFTSNEQCRELYGAYADLYGQRANLTNAAQDWAQVDTALARQAACNY